MTHNISEIDRYARHIPFLHENEATALELQRKLQKATVLIAGCGAGSTIAKPLAQYGIGTAEGAKITFADPDTVDEGNLNRQDFFEDDIGQNKAEALARGVKRKNRHVNTQVVTDGITEQNAEKLVAGSDVVVDMIDIAAPRAMYALHLAAEKHQKPVMTGLDVGFGTISYVFDYRNPRAMGLKRFLGLPKGTTTDDIEKLNSMGITAQFIIGAVKEKFSDLESAQSYYEQVLETRGLEIFRRLPSEMHPVVVKLLAGELPFLPQDGTAAQMLGAELGSIVRDLIIGEPVKAAPQAAKFNLRKHISKKPRIPRSA